MTKLLIALMALSTLASAATSATADDGALMYVGTYTGGKSKGIYAFRFDAKSGKATSLGLAAEMPSPSFLAVHPSGKYLYAVSEIDDFEKKKTGAVAALAIDKSTGKLQLLNKSASGGTGPCHLVVDKAGRNVLVANYGGGSVASIGIDDDGSLRREANAVIQHKGSSVNSDRQKEPHAHSINLDAANRFAVAADLGTDKLYVYRFDADKGTLAANDPPHAAALPGSGPRHFAFHPSGKHAYAINEMLCTLTALAYDAEKGTLRIEQTISTLPPGESVKPSYSTAEVVAHPSGKFVYGSNRGHDTIVAYAVDAASGKLTYVENESTRGKTPRNFVIDPSGKWLLAENQGSDTIAVFAIDEKTGGFPRTAISLKLRRRCAFDSFLNSDGSTMTRVCWLTDLHLNFVSRPVVDEFLVRVAMTGADDFLVGGDVAEAKDVIHYLTLIANRLPGRIAFVLGNHDFYYGSIGAVRRRATDLCLELPKLVYLSSIDEPIEIAPGVGLVGHDGWADARVGDYDNSDIMLNDYGLIAELAGMSKAARREALERLGDEAAAHIARLLPQSLDRYAETVVLTHVPPLREACWHQGQISDDEWSPHFTCLAVGNAILAAARDRPERKVTVLCGHTHSGGETQPLPNVKIITGPAVYGSPAIGREFVFGA